MKNTILTQFTLLVLSLLTFQTTIHAQDLNTKVDSLLANKFPSDAPGAVFLIAKEGKVIYNKAFGMANLELEQSMKPEQVFEIGSMTKQFTAVSILMLMEEGSLHLDDDITKYLPSYPTKGHKITIHHLLTHTSGIKNYTSIREIQTIAQKDLSPSELIDFFKNEPMDFLPGEAFKYSNSGYVILGYIIEKVSGQTYEEFIEKRIFNKLGMTSSRYASRKDIIKNRASGYHNKNGYINNREISYNIPYASGSLMSTTEDMFTWQEALKTYRLINEETTKRAFTNYTLNNGDPINYGYGWHIKTLEGMPSIEHGGHIFGFKSMGVYLPEKDIYVIGLSNCDCNSPTVITRTIAALAAEE